MDYQVGGAVKCENMLKYAKIGSYKTNTYSVKTLRLCYKDITHIYTVIDKSKRLLTHNNQKQEGPEGPGTLT